MAIDLPADFTFSRTRTEHKADHQALHRLHALYKPASAYDTLQAAIDSGYCLVDQQYTVRGALSVPNGCQIIGISDTAEIINSTTDDNVLELADGAGNVRISGVKVRGRGSSSRAVYALNNSRLYLQGVDCLNHPGTAIYLDGCNSSLVMSCRAQSSQAVTGIIDSSGKGNQYVGCYIRENEIGLYILNGRSITIESSVIEANNRGTAQTGIKCAVTDNQRAGQGVVIQACWFENNGQYAIDADQSSYVVMEGCNIQGASNQLYDVLKLDGGGLLRGCRGKGVKATTLTNGYIRTQNSIGLFAPYTNFKSEILDETLNNSATDTKFASAHNLTATGTSAPTVAHDTTGSNGWRDSADNSAKITFPTGGNGYNFSRATVGNAALDGLTAGDMVRVALALKASRAGELVNVRIVSSSADAANVLWESQTDWSIFVIEGKLDGTTALPALHLGATLDTELDVWLGGVAIVASGEVSLPA